jgi:hypothetical protein
MNNKLKEVMQESYVAGWDDAHNALIKEIRAMQIPVNPAAYNQALQDVINQIHGGFDWDRKLSKRRAEVHAEVNQ